MPMLIHTKALFSQVTLYQLDSSPPTPPHIPTHSLNNHIYLVQIASQTVISRSYIGQLDEVCM